MAVGSRPLVPSRLAPGGVAHGGRHASTTLVGAYLALTKPRIIELLLITTVPAMVLAQQGWPSTALVVVTLIGGTLAAGGANAFNMYVDRDIDRLMERTKNRPLATGRIEPRHALVFAAALEVVAFAVLWWGANLLSAVLALSATAFYVLVYTIWLKRTSRQNIVIGGAAGAVPVLVGWAAVRNDLGWAPVVLFAAMFFWTPPHFWALAIKYADDYRAADVPMLPAVVPLADAVRQMTLYTAAARRFDTGADPGRRPRTDLRRHRGRARRDLPRRDDLARQGAEPAGEHAGVRLLDHLRDRPVRRDDPRRAGSTRCVVTPIDVCRDTPGGHGSCVLDFGISGRDAGGRVVSGRVGPPWPFDVFTPTSPTSESHVHDHDRIQP